MTDLAREIDLLRAECRAANARANERDDVVVEVRQEIKRLMALMPICPQCGLPFLDRACGPTHAALAEPMRVPGEAQRQRGRAEAAEKDAEKLAHRIERLELRLRLADEIMLHDDGAEGDTTRRMGALRDRAKKAEAELTRVRDVLARHRYVTDSPHAALDTIIEALTALRLQLLRAQERAEKAEAERDEALERASRSDTYLRSLQRSQEEAHGLRTRAEERAREWADERDRLAAESAALIGVVRSEPGWTPGRDRDDTQWEPRTRLMLAAKALADCVALNEDDARDEGWEGCWFCGGAGCDVCRVHLPEYRRLRAAVEK